jgi:hypothetical protein
MMKISHSVAIMVVGSFLIQYYFMSMVMTNSAENITNSLGKFYLASLMGLSMGILEVLMNDLSSGNFRLRYYVPLVTLLFLFLFLYRNQVWIGDEQYLKEMIEHHSMALFTSDAILKKTHSYQVSKFAKNIIQGQTDEIRDMREILNSLKSKKPLSDSY